MLPRHSGTNELRTASGPCCAGDGACGGLVVALDPDAGLIAALLLPYPALSALRRVSWIIKKSIVWQSENQS